jgi:type II secretory pathway component PulC
MSILAKVQDPQFQEKALNLLKKNIFIRLFPTLLCLFLAAHALSTCLQSALLKGLFSIKTESKNPSLDHLFQGSLEQPSSNKDEIAEPIYARNLFDSSGAPIPELNVQQEQSFSQMSPEAFAKLSCSSKKLPIDFVGSVYTSLGSVKIVLLKDPEFPVADVYREGEEIFDYEDYEVFKINPNSVEFRYKNEKICYDLKPESSENKKESNAEQIEDSGTCIRFSSAEMTEAIGEGYVNILNAARLIPITDESSQPAGFRMISIAPQSVFEKIFENGDVILQVNDINMKDPSKGFSLYQSLQEEKEINILIERNNQKTLKRICID